MVGRFKAPYQSARCHSRRVREGKFGVHFDRALYAYVFTVLQHNRAPFKIAIFGRWLVVLSSREHVEEVCRAPEDTLSFSEAVNAVSRQSFP